MSPIYLDNNATTALSERALEALIEYARLPLNAGSAHQKGRQASQILRSSLATFASFLNVSESQILITSSATEAINTYIGSFHHLTPKRVITCVSEHSATLEPLKRLQKLGWKLDILKVDSQGAIDLQEFEKRLGGDVGLICLMAVNNETGVLHPIEQVADLAMHHQIPLLVDAVACAGKSPLPKHPGISAMAISPHKFHGPSGLGLLAHRHPITPLILGGGQQQARRSGTLNIALVASAAAAISDYLENQQTIHSHLLQLQTLFETKLKALCGAEVNAGPLRAPNVSNLYFEGIDAESLLITLDQKGILASHGSACQAGAHELSHVLIAMHSPLRARSSLRFSFGRMNTKEEIEGACALIAEAVRHQRAL